ncbi:uncharacterized protein [Nicotiana tomentosiformis]|uniref:uncharacterized protein n=1 Tax=Nicotiana tomentosiformis TaxID=4098 RepID=UPI00388C4818
MGGVEFEGTVDPIDVEQWLERMERLLLNFTYLAVVTLFDPGSTHSYVFSSLVLLENVKFVRLDSGVLVKRPLGHQVICNQIYRGCPFVIEILAFPANQIEMPSQDYDIIIGMDWLHKCNTLVDYRSKRVTFKASTYSHFVIQGEGLLTSNIIYAFVARKMISHECEAYLSHIVYTNLESPSLKDTPVVCEFTDVFPKNLHGLPPKREVEFPIEVIT